MSIQQTRAGFNHQDYVAVYVFLKEYLTGQLREFYVDYLYNESKQLSHDVYFKKDESETTIQHCIEVKTGDRFCTERELIGKALEEIYNFVLANPEAHYAIYISRDFRDNIATCWEALRFLQQALPLPRIGQTHRQKINYLKRLPHLNKLMITDDNIREYISRLIIMNPSDMVEFSFDHNKGLEWDIAGLVQDLGRILTVPLDTPRNRLIQPYDLTQELIYITSMYAGTNTDILPVYRRSIARFFSQVEQDVQPDVVSLVDNQSRFEDALMRHEGLRTIQPEASITEASDAVEPQL